MKRYTPLLRALLVFLLMYSIFIFGAVIEYNHAVTSEREKLEDDLLVVKTNIEQMITSRMINAKGLASLLEITDDFSDEAYNRFAEDIYESVDYIVKDVVFITDTTISHVYPNYHGDGAIGIDLAEVPDQRDILLYTKETGNAVFFGPVQLVEGGLGIIVRVPVNVNDTYYGQIAIVFDYFNFIEASGMKALVDENFVALVGSDPITSEESLIWYNSQDIAKDCVFQYIDLEQIRWTVRICPANGWDGASSLFYGILLFGALVSFVTAVIFYRRLLLKAELVVANDSLMASIAELESNQRAMERHLEQIQENEEVIQYQADHDALTQLCNRRVFTENINHAIANGETGTVVLIDLDNFKNINDSHGHIYGDRLLKKCSDIIVEAIGDMGIPYRFGGDEFLIRFEGAIENHVVDEYLAKVAAGFDGFQVDQVANHLTMSTGVVHFPKDGQDVESLLIKADVAMYNAKYSGKNCTVYFTEELLSDFDVRLSIEAAIRDGIKTEGFAMFYQPIVEIDEGSVVGFEALIRMVNQPYNPMQFIPVAEETGLIVSLGFWIIEEVVSQVSQWMGLGLAVKPVCINLSPKQLLEGDFVTKFFSILDKYGVPSSMIQVEITESVLLENEDGNISALSELHDAGIKISLDDFGTGYSSLNYLTFLPVDKVKLDKSLKDKFIRHENPRVLAGIIDMSHGLSLEVVAEGVEDKDEWQLLRHVGCDYLQGYYFSKPVPAVKAASLIGKTYGNSAKTS